MIHRAVLIGCLLSVGVTDLLWINFELAPRLLAAREHEEPAIKAVVGERGPESSAADEVNQATAIDAASGVHPTVEPHDANHPAQTAAPVVDADVHVDEAPAPDASTIAGQTEDDLQVWSDKAVLFDGTGSTELTPTARDILEHLATELLDHPEYDVLLRGHADSRGGKGFNLSLSRRRAQAVADYLERKGIASRRIGTQALGASRPVVGETGQESMNESRRVEIVLLRGG